MNKKHIMMTLSGLAILTLMTGCAQQTMKIDAGAGAKCTVKNDRTTINVTSPAEFAVNRGLNNLEIQCELNGKKAATILPPVDTGAAGLIKLELQ